MTSMMKEDEKDLKKGSKRFKAVAYIISFLVNIIFFLIVIGNQNSILMMETKMLEEFSDGRLDTESVNADAELKDMKENYFIKNSADMYTLTPEERNLVQKVVAAEARGEDIQGQMAVAQTILDRAVLWDMSVTEVALCPGQYANPYQGQISDTVRLAVSNVFDVGLRVYKEPVTHFYAGADPYWVARKVKRGCIGKHTFCY